MFVQNAVLKLSGLKNMVSSCEDRIAIFCEMAFSNFVPEKEGSITGFYMVLLDTMRLCFLMDQRKNKAFLQKR